MGVFIGVFMSFIVGGAFGFLVCALIVATDDDKEGRQ